MFDKPKILIVDDRVENLIALEKLLVGFNATIVRALSGNEALQQTLNHKFALALVDVQMPDMDGYETVTLMRSSVETRSMPVIFVSAIYREDFHVVKGIESGAIDFITKPINTAILKGKIRLFLEMHQQREMLEFEVRERKKLHDQLANKNALLSSLFSSMPDLVFYKDTSGIYIGSNKQFLDFIGIAESELAGKRDYDLFKQDVAEAMAMADIRVLQSKGQHHTEVWVSSASGQRVLLDVVKNLIINEVNEAIGIIGIARDITERHKDKQALQRAKEQADGANLAKSMFLANMSHEIRTPMNGIIGMTDILQQTSLTDEQKEYLRIIKVSGDSLLGIINDVLDFSKIEAGRITLEEIDFDLHDKIGETIKLLDFQARQKGLYLKADIGGDVPVMVCGDPLRTKQVLINLINNALKFTSSGGVTVEVKMLEVSAKKIRLLFRVIDTGIGISEEGKIKLFREFSQTDASTARKFGGTGLGLTISKRLVELMQGEIGVESEINSGSTFWFTIVYKIGGNQSSEKTAKTAALPTEGSKLKVLLVEDNPINQRVALFNLTKLGHIVDIAENGAIGLDLFMRNKYDLVLMDIQMPVMDGIEATEKIRSWEIEHNTVKVPVIAMTASAMKNEMDELKKSGLDAYLTKPFKISELQNVLALAK